MPAAMVTPPQSAVTAAPVVNSVVAPKGAGPLQNASSNAATGAASGARGESGVTSNDVAGTGSATGAAQLAPLNLNLPRLQPSNPYRPSMTLPQRSLSEMANEQLRRKPRDPFAEAVNAAGHIDCVKERPPGPLQGLLAIVPLLQLAAEEKCKK